MLDWAKIERTITEFIPAEKPPRTMYNLGVGNLPKNEASTLKAVYPEMAIYGCEPNLETCRKRTDYPGQLISAAIRNYSGVCQLHLHGNPDMASVFPRCSLSVKTPCLTLDCFDSMWGHPEDVLLWMDIEGAELEAIEGGGELLRSGRVKWINVELRSTLIAMGEAGENQVEEALQNLGYVLVKKYNHQKTHQDGIFILP